MLPVLVTSRIRGETNRRREGRGAQDGVRKNGARTAHNYKHAHTPTHTQREKGARGEGGGRRLQVRVEGGRGGGGK